MAKRRPASALACGQGFLKPAQTLSQMAVLTMGLRLSTRASQRFTSLLLSTAPRMRCTDYAICGLCYPNLMSLVLPRHPKERSKALLGRRCFRTSTGAWPEKPLRD